MTTHAATTTTWFITGASRGLGLALTRHLLQRGDRVAATSRSRERLLTAVDQQQENLLALELDLTDEAAVNAAITATAAHFGQIDVVVNNAGYGYLGAVEETSDRDVQAMFDVQVRGTWHVLRAVLPILRAQGSGHILTVSSILGLLSFPGWALYCAGKHAVEGLTEALAAEVAEHGIRVSIIEPGYFNTDFLTLDSLVLADASTDAYPGIREMVEQHRALSGSQPGDPVRAAHAIVRIVEDGNGPLRQQLGSDSAEMAEGKVNALATDIAAGRQLAHSTDYAD